MHAVRLVQVSLGSLFETTSSQDRICASAGDCGTCAMGGLTEVLWLAGVGWAQGKAARCVALFSPQVPGGTR